MAGITEFWHDSSILTQTREEPTRRDLGHRAASRPDVGVSAPRCRSFAESFRADIVRRENQLVKSYVALLRAINVGGTGKLSMADLRALCLECGFEDVATYIQSGNVVFRSQQPAARVKKTLEIALATKMGKPTTVLLRTAAELHATWTANPFPEASPSKVLVLFLDKAPLPESLEGVLLPTREELVLIGRELHIHFPDGMGRSKLKLPFQKSGTGRNLNTITKLLSLLERIR